eukprot:762462-Hanusia_phi.AAC.10
MRKGIMCMRCVCREILADADVCQGEGQAFVCSHVLADVREIQRSPLGHSQQPLATDACDGRMRVQQDPGNGATRCFTRCREMLAVVSSELTCVRDLGGSGQRRLGAISYNSKEDDGGSFELDPILLPTHHDCRQDQLRPGGHQHPQPLQGAPCLERPMPVLMRSTGQHVHSSRLFPWPPRHPLQEVTISKGAGPEEPWLIWIGTQHDDEEEANGATWADVRRAQVLQGVDMVPVYHPCHTTSQVVEARKDFCLCWAGGERRERVEAALRKWEVKVFPGAQRLVR